jgi:hypothetical protein
MSDMAWIPLGLALACLSGGCEGAADPGGGNKNSLVGLSQKQVVARLGRPEGGITLSLPAVRPGTYSEEEMQLYRQATTLITMRYKDILLRLNMNGVVTHVTDRAALAPLVGKSMQEVVAVLGEPERYVTTIEGIRQPVYIECSVTLDSRGVVTSVKVR